MRREIPKKGESVICIINSKANLTIGKEYDVLDVYDQDNEGFEFDDDRVSNSSVILVNDSGKLQWYTTLRFISKDEFRTHLINDIIKK